MRTHNVPCYQWWPYCSGTPCRTDTTFRHGREQRTSASVCSVVAARLATGRAFRQHGDDGGVGHVVLGHPFLAISSSSTFCHWMINKQMNALCSTKVKFHIQSNYELQQTQLKIWTMMQPSCWWLKPPMHGGDGGCLLQNWWKPNTFAANVTCK